MNVKRESEVAQSCSDSSICSQFPTSPLLKCRQAKCRHCLTNDKFQSSHFVKSLPFDLLIPALVPSHSACSFTKAGESGELRMPIVGSWGLGEHVGQPIESTGRVTPISVTVLLEAMAQKVPWVPGPAPAEISCPVPKFLQWWGFALVRPPPRTQSPVSTLRPPAGAGDERRAAPPVGENRNMQSHLKDLEGLPGRRG